MSGTKRGSRAAAEGPSAGGLLSKEQYKLMRDSITTKTHHHHQSGKDTSKRKGRKRVEAGEETGERGDLLGTFVDRPAVSSSSLVLEAGDVINQGDSFLQGGRKWWFPPPLRKRIAVKETV